MEESFLANYNNGDRPGGGDGVLDLFTCLTPGYYTVSFSAFLFVGPAHYSTYLFLYKNGMQVPGSQWYYSGGSLSGNVGVIGSRIVVSDFLEMF